MKNEKSPSLKSKSVFDSKTHRVSASTNKPKLPISQSSTVPKAEASAQKKGN